MDTFGAFHHRSVGTKLLFECTNVSCASRVNYPSLHFCHQVCLTHHRHNDLFGLHHICLICRAFVVVLIVVEVTSYPTRCRIMTYFATNKTITLFLLDLRIWAIFIMKFFFSFEIMFLIMLWRSRGSSLYNISLGSKFLSSRNLFRHPICFFNLNINDSLLKIQIGSMVAIPVFILFPRVRQLKHKAMSHKPLG
ncbi:hypothetical protein ACJW30_08G162500 [Castanea mollissima]